MRARWRVALAGLLAVAAVGAACDPQLADPHTSSGFSSSDEITFGTGGCILNPRVPYIRHPALGGGNSTLTFHNVAGDAMPAGAGPWFADAGVCGYEIWAPSAIFHGGQHIMHYTARKSSGQRCIGRALAGSPQGPYTPVSEWACPPDGRWAIDPSAFRAGDGQLYVAYRDDYAFPGACNTAISIVRTNSAGEALWNTRRTALTSSDVAWDIRGKASPGCPSRVRVVENPSVVRTSTGQYYLLFSTGDWQSAQYATGVAFCGYDPVGPGRCQVVGSTTRPYWAYSGSGLNPILTLPGDHPGPGAMNVYDSVIVLSGWPYFAGERRVVWHYYSGGTRYVRNARFSETPYGFIVH